MRIRSPETPMRYFQKIAYDWAIRCFGYEHLHNKRLRALRLVEEAIEVCQSVDVLPQDITMVMDTVYSRPKGELYQEVGGVINVLAIMCEQENWDLEERFVSEIRRVLRKSPEYYEARNAAKVQVK